jgi:hypothetical protein
MKSEGQIYFSFFSPMWPEFMNETYGNLAYPAVLSEQAQSFAKTIADYNGKYLFVN